MAEYNLSKEPIRIDLLVMKDKQKKTMIKNEIGHIMKIYNIIEYKSPEDGMSINDFYKTLGYAGLYKGLGEHVGEIPTNELTISMFREQYPREMIQELKKEGHEIEENPGAKNNIYAVLQASVSANFELYQNVRSDIMCQALRELMKDEIESEINEKVTENTIKTTIDLSARFKISEEETIQLIMEKCELSKEQAKEQYDKYALVTV